MALLPPKRREVTGLRRDFSNASRQKLLGLVNDVQREKISNFTDWVGGSNDPFQKWIGNLNLYNYLNNVSTYQKKVSDKNTASKKAIEDAFRRAAAADAEYSGKFSDIVKRLQKCDRFVVQMDSIIDPRNGNFTSEFIRIQINYVDILARLNEMPPNTGGMYKSTLLVMAAVIAKLLRDQNGGSSATPGTDPETDPGTDPSSIIENCIIIEKEVLNTASGLLNMIGKKEKDKDASLTPSIFSYLSSICGVVTEDTTKTTDAASSLLSLIKASGKMELGVYKYYEKKLPVFDKLKLDKKFGKTMTGVSVVTNAISALDEFIKTYDVFTDSESNGYDKAAQVLDTTGSVFDVGVNGYMAVKGGQKYLRYVDSISGSKKAVNQILVDSRELKYTTSASTSKSISTAGTVMAIGDVVISTASGGIRRYGEVSKDGVVDGCDTASVGIYGSLSGLNSVTSGLTLGAVHFDSEEAGRDIEKRASDYASSDQPSAKLIRDQIQKGKWYNHAAAFGLSTGAGVVILGEKAVNDVGKVVNDVKTGIETAGSWISSGWNHVTSIWIR